MSAMHYACARHILHADHFRYSSSLVSNMLAASSFTPGGLPDEASHDVDRRH